MKIFGHNRNLKLYQTIETLPIYNYWKCSQGELDKLVIRGRARKDVLTKQWEVLQEEFAEKVGFSDQGNEIMRKTKSLVMAELDRIIYEVEKSNKLSKVKTKIKSLSNELMNTPKTSGQTIYEQAAILSAWFKIPIDVRTMTTIQFYEYLELYQKQIEAHERQS